MKKFVTVIILVCMCFCILSNSVFAAGTIFMSATANNKFTDAWELTKISGTSKMVYGFNTLLINEDYTYTYHKTKNHSATVSNSNTTNYDNVGADQWARIEATHAGSSVTYRFIVN